MRPPSQGLPQFAPLPTFFPRGLPGDANQTLGSLVQSSHVDHTRPVMIRSGCPTEGAAMFTFESFTTLMVGAMSIPVLALLVIGLSTSQVAPDHMRC